MLLRVTARHLPGAGQLRTHFQKAMSLWNSQPSFTTFCDRFWDVAFLCRSVRRNNCKAIYLPALTTYVRFHNLLAILNTSCARAYCFDLGQSCSNVSRMASTLSLVIEIRIVCVLMVKSSASTKSALLWYLYWHCVFLFCSK